MHFSPSAPQAMPSGAPPDAHHYLTVVPLQTLQRFYGEVVVCIWRGYGVVEGHNPGTWREYLKGAG